jgi:hypothetical protein
MVVEKAVKSVEKMEEFAVDEKAGVRDISKVVW